MITTGISNSFNELDIPVVIINLLMTYFTDNYINVINLQHITMNQIQS